MSICLNKVPKSGKREALNCTGLLCHARRRKSIYSIYSRLHNIQSTDWFHRVICLDVQHLFSVNLHSKLTQSYYRSKMTGFSATICIIKWSLRFCIQVLSPSWMQRFYFVFVLSIFFYNMFRFHAAIFRRRHSYWNCCTVILLSIVWNALLFLMTSFKIHKDPGNLLIASCAQWLWIVGVLFVAVMCGYRSLLSCSILCVELL
jgi:hypothetical protein